MSKWTDMEDMTMQCWEVVDDLKALANADDEENFKTLLSCYAEVYNFKFKALSALYEDLLKEHYETKSKLNEKRIDYPLTDKTVEHIALDFADMGGDIPKHQWVPFARAVIEADRKEVPW